MSLHVLPIEVDSVDWPDGTPNVRLLDPDGLQHLPVLHRRWVVNLVADGLGIDRPGLPVLPPPPERLTVTPSGPGEPFLAAAQTMAFWAAVRPHTEILCAAEENVSVEAMMLSIEARLPDGMVTASVHRPWMSSLSNGSRIIGRIPQRDGKGVKGLRPHLVWWHGGDIPTPAATEIAFLVDQARHL